MHPNTVFLFIFYILSSLQAWIQKYSNKQKCTVLDVYTPIRVLISFRSGERESPLVLMDFEQKLSTGLTRWNRALALSLSLSTHTRAHTLLHRIIHTLLSVSHTCALTPLSNSKISPGDPSITSPLTRPLMPGKPGLCWLLRSKDTTVHKATLLSLSLAHPPACGVCLKNWSESVFPAGSAVHFGCQTLLCVYVPCLWIVVFYDSVSTQSKTLLMYYTILYCMSFYKDFWIVLGFHFFSSSCTREWILTVICALSKFTDAGCHALWSLRMWSEVH